MNLDMIPIKIWESACKDAFGAVKDVDFERQGNMAVVQAIRLLRLAKYLATGSRTVIWCPLCGLEPRFDNNGHCLLCGTSIQVW